MESARTYRSEGKEAQLVYEQDGKESFYDRILEAEGKRNAKEAESQTTVQSVLEAMKSQSIKSASLLREENLKQKLHDETLKYLFRLIYGKDWEEMYNKQYNTQETNSVSKTPGNTAYADGFGTAAQGLYQATATMNLLYVNYSYEQETTTFSTVGNVHTEDGRYIDFNVELTMSREYLEYNSISVAQNVYLTDPLIIDIDGNSTTGISDQKFFFDIDCDGRTEEISAPDEHSGFLALDLNGDGMINDGSELFGTESGNGFEELAQYDSDNNGWIDEADDVFSKLRVWKITESGESVLENLSSVGIGAIYLGSRETEFTVKDEDNVTDAVVRRTGVFLFENGKAGTLKQIDLATG